MNALLKGFVVVFSAFMVFLILNVFAQFGFPLVGDWREITTNFINFFPYLILVFLGFYYLLDRGR